MRRLTLDPRPDWQARVEAAGLIWHSAGGSPYWDESACYAFSREDIALIETATADLYRMFLAAGDHIVEQRLFDRFGIPDWCQPLIVEAWNEAPPALNYGRFDLGFDGKGPPKLFEFNCDTPTSLLEAAVVQWFWKEDVFPKADQFNALHEKLIAKWRDIAPYLGTGLVHFAHVPDAAGEDTVTVAYLMDTAREAGLSVKRLAMGDIGWAGNAAGGGFYDLEDREIRALYKLYPWEWMVHEPFGRRIAENHGRTLWIEPIWKMIWSNKAILPILWDLFPRHPNLLWARFDAPAGNNYVCKPCLAREGGNVTVVRNGTVIAETGGPYTGETLFQGLFDLPDFGNGRMPVVGSWVVDGEPAGIGVREDGPVTSNLARFIPSLLEL
ncbi:glutathionylspermidine synthase family protein [Asticcacaulis solisilvae]|uniref:glutathionylspermidine synthase family protein n=1 Tax=Asticcacaulis solisilvae TaxID=1217274 RepID=UPI003FD832FF